MSEERGLDVVIVSYRCRELLRAFLDSLREHPPSAPMKVVVVDNASGDGTAEMVRSEFPDVDLHASEANLGFAAATNLGARRGGAPYLLALNPDTRVTPGALDAAQWRSLIAIWSVVHGFAHLALAGQFDGIGAGKADPASLRAAVAPMLDAYLSALTAPPVRPRSNIERAI